MTTYRDARRAARSLEHFVRQDIAGETEFDGLAIWSWRDNAWQNLIDAFQGDVDRAGRISMAIDRKIQRTK